MKPAMSASLDPEDASGTSEYPVDCITYLEDIDCALRIVLGARIYKKSILTRIVVWALRRELWRKA